MPCGLRHQLRELSHGRGSDNVSVVRKVGGMILNIIWVPIGIVLAVIYLASGILSFISILGIPAGIVYCRSAHP